VTKQASNIRTETSPAGRLRQQQGTIAFDDAALVAQTRSGDMRAYGTLVAKYQDRIYNLVCRMTGNAADGEDLAQETFMRALERLDQFRGRSQFYTWLFRIAVNLTISDRRRAGRVRFHSLTGPDEFEQTQSEQLTAHIAKRRAPAPDARSLAGERQKRVFDALDCLEDEFKIVVVLRDIEDMDYAGIADVLGVPVGTIKSRLHRARCILKEKLADLVE